jgi:hypothetical protein
MKSWKKRLSSRWSQHSGQSPWRTAGLGHDTGHEIQGFFAGVYQRTAAQFAQLSLA